MSVSSIGAVNDVTISVFNGEKFQYESKQLTRDMGIVSCTGNAMHKNCETYLHLCLAVGNLTKKLVHEWHLNITE